VITGATRACAVIGNPVRHSLSPVIHNAAFIAANLDMVYLAFPVAEGNGQAALDAFRALDLVGLSVTMPFKFEIAKAVDQLTPHAAKLGSCNTVFRDPVDPNVLWGDSTDGDGFVRGITESGFSLVKTRAVVIGAGGAGRAVVEALGRAGAADIAIVNRDSVKAESAANLAEVARVGTAQDVIDTHLVVNATSLGMRTDDLMPVSPELLQPGQFVADLIYHPSETAFLKAAHLRGANTMNGLPMLLNQAALQFTRWTGQPAPLDAMREALEMEMQKMQKRELERS
jgi:shikimate dehydrogenase